MFMYNIMEIKEYIGILAKVKAISYDEALTLYSDMISIKGIEVALNDIEIMNRKYYLEQHPYEIYFSKADNRYRTYLPSTEKDGKRKPITSISKENLENKIINYYKKLEQKSILYTIENIYPDFLEYKSTDTSLANANKLDWVWNKFYKDDEFVKNEISKIDVPTLKIWYLNKIKQYNLTARQFKEMKSLLNMLFDYAIEKKICTQNISRVIRNISRKKFTVESKKTVAEQVFVNDEESKLIELALNQYSKTQNTAYLAVCLNFALALRVGEVVALKVSDFGENTVHIQRQEVKLYEKLPNGKIRRNGYEISPYLKSVDSDRELYLIKEAKIFLSMILQANQMHGFKSEYLMLTKDGNRMNNDAINNVLRRLNRMLKTPQKGNHSIRKTCISNMGASKALTNEEIRKFAGHKDFSTTAKHYMYVTDTIDNRSSAYETAIGSKINNVFNSVQSL